MTVWINAFLFICYVNKDDFIYCSVMESLKYLTFYYKEVFLVVYYYEVAIISVFFYL